MTISSLFFGMPPTGHALDGASATVWFETRDAALPHPQRQEKLPSLRSLCMGVLVSMGPTTLHNTLESYHAAGLIGGERGARLIVFVQAQDEMLSEIANRYSLAHVPQLAAFPHTVVPRNRFGATVVGFEEPVGKGNAWRYMADSCDREFVLYLEEVCAQLPTLSRADR